VTRPINTLFTGRDDILCELETIVRDSVKDPVRCDPCWIVISGMGGLGKSEICLQLAHRFRQSLPTTNTGSFWGGVFWIDVSTPHLAETGFLDIARRLHIPTQNWEDGRQSLANMTQSWLLVLDNADDPHVDYQQYFPAGPSGVVMLTSRNAECQQYATAKWVALDELADAEAQELLLRAAREPGDQHRTLENDAHIVASLLRSHPLALIQAGSYVSRGHCTLNEYPRVYEKQRERLLAFRPSQARSRYGDVYATFEASADILQSSQTEGAKDALQLMPVLASCGPRRFPVPLFEGGWTGAQKISTSDTKDDNVSRLRPWHVSHLLPLIQADGDAWDSFRLVEAIHLLMAFSLLSIDTHDGFLSVSMHPLVHAWARDRLSAEEQHASWVRMGCLVAISRDDDALWRRHMWQLQPHVQALTSWEVSQMFASEPPLMVTRILYQCGWLLHTMRDDAKLAGLMHRLFTFLGLDRMTVDSQWLPLYDLNARNLHNYG
jgi:NB-ARC domain